MEDSTALVDFLSPARRNVSRCHFPCWGKRSRTCWSLLFYPVLTGTKALLSSVGKQPTRADVRDTNVCFFLKALCCSALKRLKTALAHDLFRTTSKQAGVVFLPSPPPKEEQLGLPDGGLQVAQPAAGKLWGWEGKRTVNRKEERAFGPRAMRLKRRRREWEEMTKGSNSLRERGVGGEEGSQARQDGRQEAGQGFLGADHSGRFGKEFRNLTKRTVRGDQEPRILPAPR